MARNFSGSTANSILVGDVAPIDITGTALTISFWMRPASVTGVQFLVCKWDGEGVLPFQYTTHLSGTSFLFGISDGAGAQDGAGGATAIVNNTWQHVGGVKNGTGAGAIVAYVNGSAGTPATSNLSIGNTAANLRLGTDTDATTSSYTGRLAEVAIWNVALSAGEMAGLAKGASPLMFRRSNLKMYLPLFGVASPEPDLSGNGASGTVVGTVAAADHAPVGRLAPR